MTIQVIVITLKYFNGDPLPLIVRNASIQWQLIPRASYRIFGHSVNTVSISIYSYDEIKSLNAVP